VARFFRELLGQWWFKTKVDWSAIFEPLARSGSSLGALPDSRCNFVAVGGAAHFVIHGEPLARFFGPIVLSVLGQDSSSSPQVASICIGWGLHAASGVGAHRGDYFGDSRVISPAHRHCIGNLHALVLLSDDAGGQYERLARAA